MPRPSAIQRLALLGILCPIRINPAFTALRAAQGRPLPARVQR